MSNEIYQTSFVDEPSAPSKSGRPRLPDGRFITVLPRCPKCGQAYNPKKERLNVKFNGSNYDPVLDDIRLSGQMLKIFETMENGEWWTLEAISGVTGYPPASISAQLRHLRKPRFGAHVVNKKNMSNGLFSYQLVPNPATASKLKRVLSQHED